MRAAGRVVFNLSDESDSVETDGSGPCALLMHLEGVAFGAWVAPHDAEAHRGAARRSRRGVREASDHADSFLKSAGGGRALLGELQSDSGS